MLVRLPCHVRRCAKLVFSPTANKVIGSGRPPFNLGDLSVSLVWCRFTACFAELIPRCDRYLIDTSLGSFLNMKA